jgi:ABC-2 type transport system permease protein
MWARSAFQYRTSLIMLMANGLAVSSFELAATLVIFGNVKTLAGFSLSEALYLNGTAQAAFVLSDMAFTGTEYLGERIRSGTFDALLIRPVSVLAQVFTDRWSPRHLSRLVPAFGTLIAGVVTVPVHWTPLKALMVPYTVLGGLAIYGAVWILVGAFQIVATDASQAMNAVTYGSQFLTSYPMAVYGRNLTLFLTIGWPVAFVNWQPSLYVLGHADPLGLPVFFRFAAPLVAVAMWAIALTTWRAALRRHRSTGS